MTVKSSFLSGGSACRRVGASLITALFALSFCLVLLAPSVAPAAQAVTTLEKCEVAVSLDGTSTTMMSVAAGVPSSVALPCTVQVFIPMGYTIIHQVEFDSNPASPTATTKAVAGTITKEGTPFTFTLSKSHNFFFAATSPVNIYDSNAMGAGGALLAAFDVTAETDITSLVIGIKPPSAGMTGQGDSSLKTFDAGKDSAGNEVTLYGQEFKDVKKGEKKTVQVAFMQQAKAQQDATAQQKQNKAASQSQLNSFLSQPLVWLLGAFLIIVIIVLIFVIMRQRQNAGAVDEAEDDEDEPEEGDGVADDED